MKWLLKFLKRRKLRILEAERDIRVCKWGDVKFTVGCELRFNDTDGYFRLIEVDSFDPIPLAERAECLMTVIKHLGGPEQIMLDDIPDWVPVELERRKKNYSPKPGQGA